MIKEQSTAEWQDSMYLHWKQGQHVMIIGETGVGKTDLATSLLDIRDYVVALAVKRHDDTLKAFALHGYKVIKKWPPAYDKDRVILWAKPKNLADIPNQRTIIMKALEELYLAGGWCVFLDDLTYIFQYLKVKLPVGIMLNQGRSSNLSIVSAVTRPVGVLRDGFVQSTYTLAFPYEDERDVKTIAMIAGIPAKTMVQLNSELHKHDFVAFDRVTRSVTLVRNTREQ